MVTDDRISLDFLLVGQGGACAILVHPGQEEKSAQTLNPDGFLKPMPIMDGVCRLVGARTLIKDLEELSPTRVGLILVLEVLFIADLPSQAK